MAGCYLLCALYMCLNIFAVKGNIHIKDLFCQDPDTRKLYPVNSTWPSESFCGNYTCKLKQKNVTQTEYEPVTKINATEKINKSLTSDMDTSPSQQAFVVINKVQPEKHPVFHKEAINKINAIKDEYKNGGTETDRYLTESEIESITNILRTVKKSDLEAIVEIYNIAQDIYKELDSSGEEKHIINDDNIKNMMEENNVKNKLKSNAKDHVSYWYEPLHHVGTKIKPSDLKIEGTNPVPIAKSYSHPATYFKGPLTEKDFRKLPYYYPLSNFQRMSSYVNKKAPQNADKNVPFPAKTCNKKFDNIAPTWPHTKTNKLKTEPKKTHMKRSMLLPYPFSYVPYNSNLSKYPASFYYAYYPWVQLDPYSSLQNYPQSYYDAYYSQVPNTALEHQISTELQQSSGYGDIYNEKNMNSINKAKKVHLPDWQTEELSPEVLNEVKANILEDSTLLKRLNIAKNIKLEKVGKVIKLDELTRTKRDVPLGPCQLDIINVERKDIVFNIEQYEPYIEKITCESGTEPGFFRVGNLSEPYPACCPQKIS